MFIRNLVTHYEIYVVIFNLIIRYYKELLDSIYLYRGMYTKLLYYIVGVEKIVIIF